MGEGSHLDSKHRVHLADKRLAEVGHAVRLALGDRTVRPLIANGFEGIAKWLELRPCEVHAYCKQPRCFRWCHALSSTHAQEGARVADHAEGYADPHPNAGGSLTRT